MLRKRIKGLPPSHPVYTRDWLVGGGSVQVVPRRDGPVPLKSEIARDIERGRFVRMCETCGELTRWSGAKAKRRTALSEPKCTRCGKPAN